MRFEWLVIVALMPGCADFERGEPSPPSANDNANGGNTNANENDNSADPAPLGFASDIHALVIRDCAGCHASEGQASGSDLIYEDDVDADFTETLRFIDESSPEDSRFLTKASGRGHGGGATYPTTSPEYDLVLRWIAGGALP
ncbi:MAG: hypothetical protein AAF658_00205 [Myxococcota bacterium]